MTVLKGLLLMLCLKLMKESLQRDLKRIIRQGRKSDMSFITENYTICDINKKAITFYRGGFIDFLPGELHFFSDHFTVAEERRPLFACNIWLQHPLIVDINNGGWEHVPIEQVRFIPESFKALCDDYYKKKYQFTETHIDTLDVSFLARENGYDGVIFLNVYESIFNFPSCDVVLFQKDNLYNVTEIIEKDVLPLLRSEKENGVMAIDINKFYSDL